MLKKSYLLLFAAVVLTTSTAFGQFTPIGPDLLEVAPGSTGVNGIFDISALLDEEPNTVTLQVIGGNTTNPTVGPSSWTVGEGNSTTFIIGGSGSTSAFVNHGANLGSEDFQNGSLAQDGVSAAAGDTWTLTSPLDDDYTFGSQDNDFFVNYTGLETNQVESNSTGFVFVSDQPVTSFTVFSTNTTDLNNNFSVGFSTVAAVPEPAAGMLLALGGLLALRRKRS